MLYYLAILKDKCFKKKKVDDEDETLYLIKQLIDNQREIIDYLKVVGVKCEK